MRVNAHLCPVFRTEFRLDREPTRFRRHKRLHPFPPFVLLPSLLASQPNRETHLPLRAWHLLALRPALLAIHSPVAPIVLAHYPTIPDILSWYAWRKPFR